MYALEGYARTSQLKITKISCAMGGLQSVVTRILFLHLQLLAAVVVQVVAEHHNRKQGSYLSFSFKIQLLVSRQPGEGSSLI